MVTLIFCGGFIIGLRLAGTWMRKRSVIVVNRTIDPFAFRTSTLPLDIGSKVVKDVYKV